MVGEVCVLRKDVSQRSRGREGASTEEDGERRTKRKKRARVRSRRLSRQKLEEKNNALKIIIILHEIIPSTEKSSTGDCWYSEAVASGRQGAVKVG